MSTSGARFRGILLSGPVGSGKTRVLLEIGRVLEELGRPYALVDLDWLAWLSPPAGGKLSVQDVLIANLRSVWRTFRRAGVEQLVAARYLEHSDQLAAVREALPGVDLFAVRLAVSRELLAERLRRRDSGSELEQHLALVADAETPLFEDAVVGNGDHRHPRETALEVLTLAGWLEGA